MIWPDDYINKIIQGDCLELMKGIPENSVDAVITDPPAGIGFMGKEWDTFVYTGEYAHGNKELVAFQEFIYMAFKEVVRVLKPGGHAFVWAIPRTSHHTAMGIERAGFEIRDCVYHVFGSGFPKSLNIGKAVDKLQGNEREVVGDKLWNNSAHHFVPGEKHTERVTLKDTKGTSEWEGWGTALKPAVECWWLCRKPLSEKSVAENCLKWGTGGINIDESRVDYNGEVPNVGGRANHTRGDGYGFKELGDKIEANTQGRFPANLIHDNSEEVRGCFPETGSSKYQVGGTPRKTDGFVCTSPDRSSAVMNYGDSGNASRFFKSIIYQAKASKAERNMGCDKMDEKQTTDGCIRSNPESARKYQANSAPRKNHHPTVKPIALMVYLINMITRKGQTVLDPFAGSGTTAVACKELCRKFIGIELDPEYCEIARKRVDAIPERLL